MAAFIVSSSGRWTGRRKSGVDMERDLRRAFANGEFELHYQPLVDIVANRISGFESLLRWRHPDKGMISPAEFIPVAEDIGLDRLARRVGAAAGLLRSGQMARADVKVAVNLSPVQFRSRNLVPGGAFRRWRIPDCRPGGSSLKLPNRFSLPRPRPISRPCISCANSASAYPMDDFGTGYSSLSYLRSFPFDKIKIDRSFVKDLAQRADCVAIVRAISGLGRSLNITTTAEGVETVDQLDWLRAEGCNEVQGFLFSAARPRPRSKRCWSSSARAPRRQRKALEPRHDIRQRRARAILGWASTACRYG